MNVQTKSEYHAALCEYIHDLYVRKNHDYGDSFHLMFLEEGWASVRLRLTDKLNRVKQLTRKPNDQMVNDESLRDTLIDLANYSLMAVLELDAIENKQQGTNAITAVDAHCLTGGEQR